MADFFNQINYSASNEDSDSEKKSLSLSERDVVLCISGSGARALDLLTENPGKVVSIDFNRTQNYLLELKIAAIKSLDYNDYIAFLGVTDSNRRRHQFKSLETHLSPDCLSYWNKNMDVITKGVIYQGTWEKLLRRIRKLSSFRSSILNKLITADSIETQAHIWQDEWDNRTWRIFLSIISNRLLWRIFVKEPGVKYIPNDFSIKSYMKAKLDYMALTFNLQKEHFANLILFGKYSVNCSFPAYLLEENYSIIRQNLDRITIVNDSVSRYLDTRENYFTAFSLSDFSSYSSSEEYLQTWRNIVKSAKDSATFCERQFLVKRSPELHFNELERNKALETELEQQDKSFIYTFCVGKIRKSK